MLDPDVRRVLDGTSIAHLATVVADGSPPYHSGLFRRPNRLLHRSGHA